MLDVLYFIGLSLTEREIDFLNELDFFSFLPPPLFFFLGTNKMESNGFRNTPVTKLLVPIVGGCSSLVIAYNSRPNLQLPVNSQVKREKEIKKFKYVTYRLSIVFEIICFTMDVSQYRHYCCRYLVDIPHEDY